MTRFVREADFHALSLTDLADARDAYHVHLANLENVVGTALGRYLIRREDPEFNDPDANRPGWSKEPRTLGNSGVRKWSWPCVLVFVDEWMVDPPDGSRSDQVVPRRLYLPDGRQVPTCVVYTPLAAADGRASNVRFTSATNGPGRPLFTEAQGRRRMGTIGPIVTDGAKAYALASRHVLGAPGAEVSVVDRGDQRRIGSAAAFADRRTLAELYPGVAGTRAEISLDAGLVELDDLDGWTTQLFGLGAPGDLIDVNVDTVALGLIDCPVTSFGAGSGEIRGSILGLFHRWRTVGGVDQIAELLIGPRPDGVPVDSRRGDSGATWVWDAAAELGDDAPRQLVGDRNVPVVRPLALQWGGQITLDAAGGRPTDYVLASTLSSVTRALGVTLLHDDSLSDHSLYWGKVGHYKVAEAACHLAEAGTRLATLLANNVERIGVSDANIEAGNLPSAKARDQFIALADVPDLVWRSTRQKDAASHFADMDEPGGAAVDNKTLMELWGEGGDWRTPAGWTAFYDSLASSPKDRHRGALPFRVAQLYDVMVAAVEAKDIARFVTAAGVLAHYVGDACQPLHVSRLHHGLPDDSDDDKVHAVYETDMLDRFAPEVITGVNDLLDGYQVGDPAGPAPFAGAANASVAVVDLMARTIAAIEPAEILDVFNTDDGRGRAVRLWDAFGARTLDRLADGSRTLAVIWQAAWVEGGGESISKSRLKKQPAADLQAIYEDKSFAPNEWLKDQ